MTINDVNKIKVSISNGVDLIADTVAKTLGPQGANAILYNNNGIAFTTKDGISVAKKIVCKEDPVAEAAIQIMREASAKTAELAGDGTTTTLILAQDLYDAGDIMLEEHSIEEVKAELNKFCKAVVNTLKAAHCKSVDFNYDTIKYIATTSANNDDEIGKIVADTFIKVGEEGTVQFDLEQTPLTYVEAFEGSRYDIGTIAKEFFTSLKRGEAYYENCNVLCLNSDVRDLESIKSAVVQSLNEDRPLVIFATAFAEKAMEQMFTNNVKANTRILPINVVGNSLNKKDVLTDIAILTNTEVYETIPKSNSITLGKCKKIIASLFNTLIAADPNEATKQHIEDLKEALANTKAPELKALLNKRLGSLKGKLAIIHVGGTTDVEAKERYDRVEDAICAVKAALEEGISQGGGATFLHIWNELYKKGNFKTYLLDVLKSPFYQLEDNSGVKDLTEEMEEVISNKNKGYNFLTHKIENLYNTGVIDPTKVLRLAIENATSVAIQLLSVKACVTDYKFDPYSNYTDYGK